MGFNNNAQQDEENDFSEFEMRRVGAVTPSDGDDDLALTAAKKLGSAPYRDRAAEEDPEDSEYTESSWLYGYNIPRFDAKRRCCCCLGSLVSEYTMLGITASLLTFVILVLMVLMLVSGGIVMPWLHSHADDLFVYGSLSSQPGGTYPPTAMVLYGSCAWPLVPFDNLGTPPPPYLDPDTCTSGAGGSCCPVGYLRNTTTNPKLKPFDYCASSETRCENDFAAKGCVTILANKSHEVTNVPYRGLLVQVNVASADWSWGLLFALTPLAILLLAVEVSFVAWEVLRSKHVSESRRPEPTLANPTKSTPAESAELDELREISLSYPTLFNRGCGGAMIVGCLMAALLLTGGLSGIFASTPDIDDANSLSACFVNPTPQTSALLDPLTTWYTMLVLTTMFSSLLYIFALFAHVALMFPQIYNTLWRWDVWLYISLLTCLLVGVSVFTSLMKELL